jgi:hypothetical protein
LFDQRDSPWGESSFGFPEPTKAKFDIEKELVLIVWSLNGIDIPLGVPKGMM